MDGLEHFVVGERVAARPPAMGITAGDPTFGILQDQLAERAQALGVVGSRFLEPTASTTLPPCCVEKVSTPVRPVGRPRSDFVQTRPYPTFDRMGRVLRRSGGRRPGHPDPAMTGAQV